MIKCSKCGEKDDLSYIGICRNSEPTYFCNKCEKITYIKNEGLKNE